MAGKRAKRVFASGPAIHVLSMNCKDVDVRHKAGHDDGGWCVGWAKRSVPTISCDSPDGGHGERAPLPTLQILKPSPPSANIYPANAASPASRSACAAVRLRSR